MQRWYRPGFILLIGCVWLLRPQTIHACSPIRNMDPARLYAQADGVFVGEATGRIDLYEVAEVLHLDSMWPHRFFAYPRPAQPLVGFKVIQSWKGISTTRVTLLVDIPCGDTPYADEQFVVYAAANDDLYHVIYVQPLSDSERSANDLAYLTDFPTISLTPVPAWSTICLMTTLLPLILVILFFWRRQRRLSVHQAKPFEHPVL